MYKEILSCINEIIGLYMNGCNPLTDEFFYYNKLKEYYYELQDRNGKEDFYIYINKIFASDFQLLCIIYSILVKLDSTDFTMRKMYKVLLEQPVDYFLSNSIRYQLGYLSFTNLSMEGFNQEEMELHNKYLQEIIEKYGLNFPKLRIEECNEKRIVIVASQMISEYHAPTAIVLKIASVLKYKLGYEVKVLCLPTVCVDDLRSYWINNMVPNYVDIDLIDYVYENKKIEVINIPFTSENIENIKECLKDIYAYKPSLVWYIGGNSIVGDLVGQMTTSLAMSCSTECALSNADFVITYKEDDVRNVKDQGEINCKNQVKLFFPFRMDERSKYTGNLRRTDIKCDIGDFLIGISGNRLEQELTDDYIEMLVSYKKIEHNIKYMFCGVISMDLQRILKEKLQDVIFLGFREDLVDVYSLCNLILNPPRKGGGGVGMIAMSLGIPIVSLKCCDVSNNIGEDYCCSTYKEYNEVVNKLIKENDSCVKFGKRLKEKYDRLDVNQYERNIGKILEEIKRKNHSGL